MPRKQSSKKVQLSKQGASAATVERAQEDLRKGKSASTAAGEFVREVIERVRRGVHGVRSPKQAIAIGLSKARRAGVPLPAPKRGQTSERTRKTAEHELEVGPKHTATSAKRSRASTAALKREPRSTVSKQALGTQARRAAAKRKGSRANTTTAPKRTTTARRRK